MRQFITTDIVDPVKAPITEKALRHLNDMPKELADAIVKGLIGGSYTTNDLVVLYGCVVTASIPGDSSITAGAIYLNGEVYLVDADAVITTAPGQTLVWSASNTLQDGIQTRFSDGNDYNFLSIRKLQLTAAASGSGLANYNGSTVKYCNSIGNADDVLVDSTSIASANSYFTATAFMVAIKSGCYVDLNGIFSITITDATGFNGTSSAEDVIFDLKAPYQFASDAGAYIGCGVGHRVGVYSLAADIQQGVSATKLRVRITKGPGTSVNAHTIDVAFSVKYKGVA